MDRTLFFGVIAGLGLAAALAGWALGWPGPALVAAAAAWGRIQLRLGAVARGPEAAGQRDSEAAAAAGRPADAVVAALPWGAALAAAFALAWIVLAR